MTTMQAAQNKLQVIHFLVQNVHLCFEIQYISKVLPLVEMKPIPNSPNYLAGLMNIAEKSIPVIDLAIRLGLKRTEKYSLSTPIILCNEDSKEIGLIVDEILGLAIVDKSTFQMQNSFSDPESLFRAVVSIDAKLALVLNMQQTLSIQTTPGKKGSSFDISSVNLTGFKYE